MKISTFVLLSLLSFSLLSCKKTGDSAITPAATYFFVVTDKNGTNIIHSLNDSLTITYVLNGKTVTNHLSIFKVRQSITDSAKVSKYNGYIISDQEYANGVGPGYMTTASHGGDLKPVHNFNLFLNGKNLGVIYFDFDVLGNTAAAYQGPLPSFSLKGLAGKSDYMIGVYDNGNGIQSQIEQDHDAPQDSRITVLQLP